MLEIRKSYPMDAYTLIKINDTVWKKEFYDVLPSGIFQEMGRYTDRRVNHLRDQIQENNRIFVALDDDVPVGFVFYARTQNVVYNASAEIRSIYVLPEYQRQGIGTKLFEMAVDELKKIGFRSVIVDCPLDSNGIQFFLKMGGVKKEIISKKIYGFSVMFDLVYIDLEHSKQQTTNEWNHLYLEAQENLVLLNDLNREIAVLMTASGNMYLGIGIKNRVCPIESALANMYLASEKKVAKILILDRRSKPVLPCGKCRDLLISLGQEEAEILFDVGTLKTMTMRELNPYYKDEEKV